MKNRLMWIKFALTRTHSTMECLWQLRKESSAEQNTGRGEMGPVSANRALRLNRCNLLHYHQLRKFFYKGRVLQFPTPSIYSSTLYLIPWAYLKSEEGVEVVLTGPYWSRCPWCMDQIEMAQPHSIFSKWGPIFYSCNILQCSVW